MKHRPPPLRRGSPARAAASPARIRLEAALPPHAAREANAENRALRQRR